MYKIEENIPRIAPHIGFCKSRHDKFPWHKMCVGDSFLIPEIERNAARSSSTNFSEVAKRQNRTAPRIRWSICRWDKDNYRIWRIA